MLFAAAHPFKFLRWLLELSCTACPVVSGAAALALLVGVQHAAQQTSGAGDYITAAAGCCCEVPAVTEQQQLPISGQ